MGCVHRQISLGRCTKKGDMGRLVERLWEKRNACRVLVGEPKGKRTL
jgi:hypothetical protein